VRERYYFNPTAVGQTWPGPGDQPIPAPFNWCKVDNRGAGDVAVGFASTVQAASGIDYYLQVRAGQVRVFNLGGPKNGDDSDHWPNRLFLRAIAATTVLVEIADHPIVDLQALGAAGGVTSPSIVRLVDGSGNTPDLSNAAISVKDTSQFFIETTVALGASATFTGPWRDTLNLNWLAAIALTDAATAAGQGLAVDEADAAVPTIINTVSISGAGVAPITGNVNSPSGGFVHRVVPQKIVLRFNRLRYLNGPTVQTRLNVQSAFSPVN
jgi:hypothetical protein